MSDFSFRSWQSFPSNTPPIVSPPVAGPPGPPGPPGPAGDGITSRSIEIDFGSVPVQERKFTVIDSEMTPTSRITGSVAYVPPTGKSLDEVEVDDLSVQFGTGVGQFDVFVRSLGGSLSGKFIVHYFVSES